MTITQDTISRSPERDGSGVSQNKKSDAEKSKKTGRNKAMEMDFFVLIPQLLNFLSYLSLIFPFIKISIYYSFASMTKQKSG
jgi:hypothetical protein